MLMQYIPAGLHCFALHQVVLSMNLRFFAYNIEISLEDLISQNVRAEKYFARSCIVA